MPNKTQGQLLFEALEKAYTQVFGYSQIPWDELDKNDVLACELAAELYNKSLESE